MRFEIRAGGALLFLIGLAVLSGAVFALGLIAGYEMARQNQVDSSQLATNYPLPSPQAAAASPSTAPSPAVAIAVPPPANPPMNTPPHAAAPAIANAHPAAAPHVAPPPPPPAEEAPEEASVPPAPAEENPAEPNTGVAANPPASGVGAMTPPPNTATTPPASVAASESPLARRHPYNIQIDAVMDDAGAQQMVSRLRKLGYPATIVPSTIAGQTWYRVKVGPYATQAEARTAQERLRAQYNAAYAGH